MSGLYTYLWACSISARVFWSFSHSSRGAGPTVTCAARRLQSGGLCTSSGRRSRGEDNVTWCVMGSVEGKPGTCPFRCWASPEALHMVTPQYLVSLVTRSLGYPEHPPPGVLREIAQDAVFKPLASLGAVRPVCGRIRDNNVTAHLPTAFSCGPRFVHRARELGAPNSGFRPTGAGAVTHEGQAESFRNIRAIRAISDKVLRSNQAAPPFRCPQTWAGTHVHADSESTLCTQGPAASGGGSTSVAWRMGKQSIPDCWPRCPQVLGR